MLGPILYLIYVNDVGFNTCGSEIIMFADDTVLLNCGEDPDLVCKGLECDLLILYDYFLSLKLSLNANKTKIMNFNVKIGRVNKLINITRYRIHIEGQVIEEVDKFKYLGIMIDNNLRFDVQLKTTVKSVNRKLYFLSKIRRYINGHTAVIMYKTMALPYLEYANCFLIGCNQVKKTNYKDYKITV